MRYTFITTLTLSTSVSATVVKYQSLPRDAGACPFTLTAHGPGSASGIVGQLGDGQNRIGGGYPTATFYHQSGSIIDSSKRGCILTPRTEQWQCDQGVAPHPGFSIECDGTLFHNGSLAFHACPVNDHGEWNVYTAPVAGQKKCVAIKLTASGCTVPCPAAPSPVVLKPTNQTNGPPNTHIVNYKWTCDEEKTCHKEHVSPQLKFICNGKSPCHMAKPSPPAKSQPACTNEDQGKCYPTLPPPSPSPTRCHEKDDKKCTPTPTMSPALCNDENHGKATDKCHLTSCPVDLNGAYEFPHLIVPVHKYHRDLPMGNKLNGTIDEWTCTTYNFDIHPDDTGKTCSLIFLLPKHEDLETSSYKFEGEGYLHFNKLSNPVNEKTTFNNKGAWTRVSTTAIEEDTKISAWSGPCEAGKKVGYEVCGEGIDLEYFQDYNPSPIGLYMRVC